MTISIRKITGNALAQYGIVLAIIAIGLVPVFILLGDNIKGFLSSFNSVLGDNNSIIQTNSQKTTSPVMEKRGTLGGSASAPKVKCTGENCIIDFGDYSLEGIPGDFDKYIQGAGATGGTDKLVALLEQLAEKAPVDEDTKNLIQLLASKGHIIADTERSMIDVADNNSGINLISDLHTAKEEGRTSILSSLSDDSEVILSFQDTLNLINSNIDSSLDPKDVNTLAIVKALANDIMNIRKNLDIQIDTISDGFVNDDGYLDGTGLQYLEEAIYDGSIVTDLDSTIICGVGNGNDNGYNCN